MLSRPGNTKDETENLDSNERARLKELTAELDRMRAELKKEVEHRKEAEAALREAGLRFQHSEERYREIFENANDIVYTQGLDGYYLDCNKATERLTGYSRDELLSMHMNDLMDPD
jgi:PAS domain-containing protein